MNKEQYIELKNKNSYTIEMLYEMYMDTVDRILIHNLPMFQIAYQQYMIMGGSVILEKVYIYFDKKFKI